MLMQALFVSLTSLNEADSLKGSAILNCAAIALNDRQKSSSEEVVVPRPLIPALWCDDACNDDDDDDDVC